MKIHEYQARDLFREYGIPTTSGIVVDTPEEAVSAAAQLGLPVVLKAQVYVGGRGKAGGVKVISSSQEVAPAAKAILGLTIKGLPVRKLLVAEAVYIRKEVYLSLLIDRSGSRIVFLGCSDGGVEIEETAKKTPEKIMRLPVRARDLENLSQEQLLPFASSLFSDASLASAVTDIMIGMGKMFKQRDCSLIEINPLIVDAMGSVIAIDGKVLMDDNALFRQERNLALKQGDADDPEAKNGSVSFVQLDGNIGCMVNGAGLAMATMDIVKHFGGSPANFLDAGGSSDPGKVVHGFEMILQDPNVKVIFLNIFGGITRCDDIVRGILDAKSQFDVPVPIVIRLAGTNEKEGKDLLKGTDMIVAESLEEGARTAVAIGRSA